MRTTNGEYNKEGSGAQRKVGLSNEKVKKRKIEHLNNNTLITGMKMEKLEGAELATQVEYLINTHLKIATKVSMA